MLIVQYELAFTRYVVVQAVVVDVEVVAYFDVYVYVDVARVVVFGKGCGCCCYS